MVVCCIFANKFITHNELLGLLGMVSFIVTTYNLEDWLLRRCLSSIVAQGLARDEYEIIVVDDESMVSPQHVVDEFSEQVNITLYVQQHARQGAARNLALSHAKGEWVEFVDGDDYLFAGAIAPLLRSAEANDLDMLMFTFREVHDSAAENGSKETTTEYANTHPDGNDFQFSTSNFQLRIATGDSYMLHHNLFGACWGFLFRRSLLDDPQHGAPLRFTEGIYIEDEEFVTHLVWRAQRMAKVDVAAYAYYQRAGSTVHSPSREHTDELFRSYFVVLKRLMAFEASLGDEPHAGLTRKVRFLALDVLRRALREPDWTKRWNESAQQLRSLGAYPLPVAHYSWKYSLFRLLAQCGIGRQILRMIEK